MIEALWAVSFASNVGLQAVGAGVVVFETGRALGGDGSYYYLGDYSIDGDTITGKIKVTHFFGQPQSVFGPDKEFTLRLSGEIGRENFTVTGHRIDKPDLQIGIHFRRLAELP